METILLKDYFYILKKHLRAFSIVLFSTILLSILVTYLLPKNYTSSIDIYVRHKSTGNSNQYYTYDGYYSTQASVGYTNTVAGFLQSVSTLSNAAILVSNDPVYKERGYKPADPTQPDFLAGFQKNIDIKIVAPQLINVAVHESDPIVARLWAQSLGQVVTNNLKQLNIDGDSNYTIDTIHAPITQTNKLNLVIDLAIGVIVGVFLGFVVGFILEAYKK